MIVIQNKALNCLLKGDTIALCIWPFLFVKQDVDQLQSTGIINHELIHARQQLEMLWIFFFLWYGIEYLVRLLQKGRYSSPYRALSLEREAYENENDPDYLERRKAFTWIRYL
jgi:hypothetical protein